jgi:small subunit ribosomal protein S20
MANTKASKQDILVTERNRRRNVAVRSRMKTYIKQAEDAIEAKDAEKIPSAVRAAVSQIDRAACKGVIKANSAARKKSSLQRRAAI